MEQKISFKKTTLDIVEDVIQEPILTGRYRGIEVKEILEKYVDEMESNSLLVIDLRKALPLDYPFCQFAFGPLLKMLQDNKSDCKFFLYHMQESHKSCFFRGVMKHIKKDLPRSKSMEAFVEADMFTMIKVGESNEIKYVSNLNTIEQEILELIDEEKSISGRKISEKKKDIPFESIGSALRSLNRKGFIVHIKNNDDNYHSIYNYL